VTFSSPAHIAGREEKRSGAQMTCSGLPVSSSDCCSYNCISTSMINAKIIMYIHMSIYVTMHIWIHASHMYVAEEKS